LFVELVVRKAWRAYRILIDDCTWIDIILAIATK
jgi:hypothetical protein